MKNVLLTIVSTLTLASSASALADWSGDILCVKPSQSQELHPLVADAKGRISVKTIDDLPVAQINLTDLRLFSEHGSVKGSNIEKINLKGKVFDGNDSVIIKTAPIKKDAVISQIQFDFSSLDRGLSTIRTSKGNAYQMDCVVRVD